MSEHTAETIRVNGEVQPWSGGSVEALLSGMGHDLQGFGIAVAVNGEIVRRVDWTTRQLQHGDAVEVVGAVQGG